MKKNPVESAKDHMKDFEAIAEVEQRRMERDLDALQNKGNKSLEDYGTATTSRPEPGRYGKPETVRNAHDRGGNKLKKAVAMVAFAGATLGANKLIDTVDQSAEGHFEKVEQTALAEVDHAWNSVAVLHKGAKYRKAPITVNNEPEEGPDTVAGTVGNGKVIRINNPLVYVEELKNGDTETWLGFTLGDKPDETNADPTNIYWANLSGLSNQETNGHELVSVYDYAYIAKARQENPDQQFDPRYDVSINLDQPIEGSIGSKNSQVADGHMVSTDEFERDIQQEGLVYAYK